MSKFNVTEPVNTEWLTELAIGNMIRRVLYLIREEYTQQQDEQPAANVSMFYVYWECSQCAGLFAPFKYIQFGYHHAIVVPSVRRG